MTAEEKKNDRWGLGVSLGIHAALFILFIFLLAWKEPFPPLPEYGIEVNFGLDNAGSGDIQPNTPANNNPTPVEDPAPEAPAPAEEQAPEPVSETTAEDNAEPEPVEPEAAAPVEDTPITQPQPDVVPVEEAPKQEKTREEPVVKETPKLDPAAAYPNRNSNTAGADGTEGQSREPASSNQGDQPGETGDQGNPDGKLDARALYGNPGGGGGAALDMTGWKWDRPPEEPDDVSNESGKIVFRITIDDEGYIVSIQTIEQQVPPALVKMYEAEVRKLTFSKTSDNSRTAPTSTGHITFIIKAR